MRLEGGRQRGVRVSPMRRRQPQRAQEVGPSSTDRSAAGAHSAYFAGTGVEIWLTAHLFEDVPLSRRRSRRRGGVSGPRARRRADHGCRELRYIHLHVVACAESAISLAAEGGAGKDECEVDVEKYRLQRHVNRQSRNRVIVLTRQRKARRSRLSRGRGRASGARRHWHPPR